MLGELLSGLGGRALESAVEEIIRRSGPSALAAIRSLFRVMSRAAHPSLEDLRTICDHLQRFLTPNTSGGGIPFRFAKEEDASAFKQKDMTIKEVTELWFRTDTKLYRERIEPIAAKWQHLAPEQRLPYFSGAERINFDYSDHEIKESVRHPLFRSVHPFIMVGRTPRAAFGVDPVGDVLDFFLDGWEAFIVPGHTDFKLAKAVLVGNQAFAEGYFITSNVSQFRWKSDFISTEVRLWRCVMITANANSVDIMNVGIPAASVGGYEYLAHFEKWMNEFKVLSTG